MKKIVSIVLLALVTAFWTACGSKDTTTGAAAAETAGEAVTTDTSRVKTILFFGNSLTAGYGIDPQESFPSLIQNRLDSLHYRYKVVNAGVSGETSASGNSRIDWVLKNPVDIFVLELGGNDGLRGIPVAETRKNLQSILDKVKAKYPAATIILAGMQMPPSMGSRYTEEFRTIFPELARQNGVALIPFLLEGVGGEAGFNLKDGIHPNAAGARIVADNVWAVLEKALD